MKRVLNAIVDLGLDAICLGWGVMMLAVGAKCLKHDVKEHFDYE